MFVCLLVSFDVVFLCPRLPWCLCGGTCATSVCLLHFYSTLSGSMTVLTLVTMGFGGRASLPRVNYATALDWFVVMCFTFVFTALVEYACVNYIERLVRVGRRSANPLPQRQDSQRKMLKSNHIYSCMYCRLLLDYGRLVLSRQRLETPTTVLIGYFQGPDVEPWPVLLCQKSYWLAENEKKKRNT